MRQGGLNQGFSKTFLFGDPLLKKFFLGDHLMGSLEVSDTWKHPISLQKRLYLVCQANLFRHLKIIFRDPIWGRDP